VLTGAAWALMLHHAISMSASMESAGRSALGVEMRALARYCGIRNQIEQKLATEFDPSLRR
jgi:hypothetical protein